MKLRTIRQKLKPPQKRGPVEIREKKAAPFYASREWKALMSAIIRARGRACEDPDHDAAMPRHGIRLYGDHIIELRDNGPPLDPNNIMLRCAPCHGAKTAATAAARRG